MPILATWYLIIVFGGISAHSNALIPMHTKQACVAALQTEGNYCINTETGEILTH